MIPMATPMFGRGGAGAPAPFSPLDLNPYAWFDFNQQAEANLGAISTLVDRSPNGRDFAQSNATFKPHLLHSDINSTKVGQFGQNTGGSNTCTFLERASSFLSGVTAAHAFALIRARDDPSIGPWDGGFLGQMENHAGDTHVPYSDFNSYSGFCSSARKTFVHGWDLSQWNIWEEWSAGSDYGVNINGWPVYSTATNTVSIDASTRRIGSGSTITASAYFRGKIADMLFFNSKLSAGDSADLLLYLAEKIGIENRLINTHPGKTYPTAQRWRIRAIDTDGTNDAFGMRELQAYATTDGTGTDLFAGGTAISSHNDGSYPNTNAFNGNTADFWTSLGSVKPTGGHWIGRIATGAIQPKSFRMQTRGDFNETPKKYTIEYSTDAGATWNMQRSGGAIAGNTWVVIPL